MYSVYKLKRSPKTSSRIEVFSPLFAWKGYFIEREMRKYRCCNLYFPECKLIHPLWNLPYFNVKFYPFENVSFLLRHIFEDLFNRFLPFDQVSISKLSKEVSYSSVQHAIKLSFLRKSNLPSRKSIISGSYNIRTPMTIEIKFLNSTKSTRKVHDGRIIIKIGWTQS